MTDSHPSPNRVRFAPLGVLVLTVLVFALTVLAVTVQLRAGLRDQILRREADTLAAAVSMQLDGAVEVGDAALAETGTLLVAALKTSKWRGVSGVRVFDAERKLSGAFPFAWATEGPAGADWARLAAGDSVARWHPDLASEDVVGVPLNGEPQPSVEIWVPLRRSGSPNLIGAAQFWVRGGKMAADLGEHDRRLWIQAVLAWLVGSAVIVAGLSWAFRRLAVANRELRVRGEDLQRANRELVLAAKTSALGAVTAHLMHELKNPLAGLEVLVAGQADGTGSRAENEPGGELAAASALTRRLRTMVNDVVGVLRDEQTGAVFALTGAEVAEIAAERVRSDAAARGVTLEIEAKADAEIAGRRGNLATLVLRNLLQNAIEATPRGGRVALRAKAGPAGATEFFVEDGGPGLPDSVRARLFQPCTSTKVGGSGLGLALSYQLAQQAGGKLELERSDGQGTTFRLVLAAEA